MSSTCPLSPTIFEAVTSIPLPEEDDITLLEISRDKLHTHQRGATAELDGKVAVYTIVTMLARTFIQSQSEQIDLTNEPLFKPTIEEEITEKKYGSF